MGGVYSRVGVGKIFKASKSQNELKGTFSDVKWAYKSIGVFDLVLFLCLSEKNGENSKNPCFFNAGNLNFKL